MDPTFSVFVPARNDARWLPGAIASVLAQTHPDWELVIGDNASTDDTRTAAASADPRVRSVHWAEGVDMNASFNRTAAECRAPWIVPIGADDRLLPDALATFAQALRTSPAPSMVVAECLRQDPDGRPAAATWRFYQALTRIEAGDYDARAWIEVLTRDGQPPWNLGSVAFAKDAVLAAGGFFDPDAGAASDIELIMRLAAVRPVRYVRRPVLVYTQRTDSDQREHQLVNRDSRTEETILGRALRVGLRAHVALRGAVTKGERRRVAAATARAHVQRALQHRLLHGGGGRRAAVDDLARAWRTSPRAVLAPRQLMSAAGALAAPTWSLRLSSRILRERRA
jgi:GT2 family glycosyltransferase